ncbi:MAG: proton-conducting membrane transporter [Clostridium sp.]|nr:proton-conducting membrane transporter [Clostridium sp.]MCM1171325.1 proton-conducting membrane transporter [Clostridium sp.]MCM1208526.1 proton-conducting membrane transporter [Ruminococcus sp.]
MEVRLNSEFIIRYRVDELGVIFAILATVMYVLIGIYHTGYFKRDNHKKIYYVFYCISYLSMLSQFFADNLITMYISFELISFSTAMLVFHDRNKASEKGGFRILYFSIAGAFTALFGVFALYANKGADIPFVKGGSLGMAFLNGNKTLFLVCAFLMIIGFGVKAAILPYHAWLPEAHPVAPAPGSALLSGVVVKCGVFAVIRTVFYVFGTGFIMDTWVQTAWMALAIVSILLGSMLAYREKIFKKRLAYSTVSQMNYIMFGLSLLNEAGVMGSLIHVIMHAMVKITLFLVAGNIIHQTGKKLVDEFDGLGKYMPVTFCCYTIAGITLVGIPPAGTFLSKWYIASGALEFSGAVSQLAFTGMIVIMISALLTAGYLFPVTIKGYFGKQQHEGNEQVICEPKASMTAPLIVLVILTLILAVYPDMIFDELASFVAALM